MRTALRLPHEQGDDPSDGLHGGDVRMPRTLGRRLLDGFADFGTTLVVVDGSLLIEAANLAHDDRVTTFAWDPVDPLRTLPTLRFAGEHVVSWAGDAGGSEVPGVYGFGYDHSDVLVFERP